MGALRKQLVFAQQDMDRREVRMIVPHASREHTKIQKGIRTASTVGTDHTGRHLRLQQLTPARRVDAEVTPLAAALRNLIVSAILTSDILTMARLGLVP